MGAERRVVVIGGGISGLSTAFWLQQEGVDVVVLERSHRVGGVIRSEQVDGYTVDHAANCLMNFLPEVNYLCETVGLSTEQIPRQAKAENRYMVKHGKAVAVPTKVKDILLSPYWSLSGKLRMMLEPFIPAAAPDAEESVADFIRRRFGRELYERAIEPFVAGTLSGDAERTCAKSTLPKFHEFEQKYGSIIKGAVTSKLVGAKSRCPRNLFSFKQGMETLPNAIAEHLGDSVRLNTGVSAIKRVGQRWLVRTSSGGTVSETIEADAVVIATPSQVAANLVQSLSTLLASQLNSIVYSPMVILALGLDEKNIEHPLDGIGCLVPAVERNHLLGSLWSSSLFAERAPDGKALITCYMGGMVDKGALECSDEELVNRAMQDLKGLIGASGEPEFVRVVRHARGLPQYHLGHQKRLEVIDGQLRLLPGLRLTGNYLDGVSVRDCIARGKTMAGKIISDLPDMTGLKLIEGSGERENSDDVETSFSTVGSSAR